MKTYGTERFGECIVNLPSVKLPIDGCVDWYTERKLRRWARRAKKVYLDSAYQSRAQSIRDFKAVYRPKEFIINVTGDPHALNSYVAYYL